MMNIENTPFTIITIIIIIIIKTRHFTPLLVAYLQDFTSYE